jgi:hypothetical protein
MAGGPARNTHIANDDDMSVYDCVEACCPLSFVQVPSADDPAKKRQTVARPLRQVHHQSLHVYPASAYPYNAAENFPGEY